MFNKLLEKVEGADIWMVLSFMIFFIFFIVVVLYLIKADKKHIKKMREMPIREDIQTNKTQLS